MTDTVGSMATYVIDDPVQSDFLCCLRQCLARSVLYVRLGAAGYAVYVKVPATLSRSL